MAKVPLSEIVGHVEVEEIEEVGLITDVVILVKGLTDAGEVAYWRTKSPGVTDIEAFGMLSWYAERIEDGWEKEGNT